MLKIKYFGIILLIALAVVCVSCGSKNKGSGSAGQTKGDGNDFMKEDAETFNIDNPICALKYPSRWKDCVQTEVKTFSDGCSVTFQAVLDGKNIDLFCFIMRDMSEDGNLLGILKTKNGEINIYLMDLFDEEEVALLSEESAAIYDEMLYDFNIVISKLVYDNNMTLVG